MSQPPFVFFGTSRFAEVILEKLKEHNLSPTLIVTGEDKPQGRGLVLTHPPVKLWADKNSIPAIQPKNLKDPKFISRLEAENSEIFILASYGKIIPSSILALPEKGILNVHPSLLPRLRGPSPIQSAILEENETGVSIMLLDEEVDHGPILAQEKAKITDWPPYYGDLETVLAEIGSGLLADVIPKWIAGEIKSEEQNHSLATFTKKIAKENARIDLSDSPEANLRKIRAYSNSPVAYTEINTRKGKLRIKIKKARIENNSLVLETVTPEGSKEMSWNDFSRGFL